MKQLELKKLPVKDILIGENMRKSQNVHAAKELEENIKLVGILEPLVVRKDTKGFTLIAGFRRMAAAKNIGIKEVPCSIMELTDEESTRVQTIENLHREDINPIEEAEHFAKMMNTGKKQAADLAKELSKSVKYVWRAVQLLQLPKEIQKLVKEGKISTNNARLLNRVEEDRIKKVMEYVNYQRPDEDMLKRFIDKMISKDLASAPFDRKECDACPSHSKNMGMLFDGASAGLCDDGACFRKKMAEYYKNLAEKAAQQGPFKDMKCLGRVSPTRSYSTDLVTAKGGVLITDKIKNRPEVKEALKDKETRCCFILNADNENKPEIIITDKLFVEKLTKGKTAQESDFEKDRFVRDAITEAVVKAFKDRKGGVLKGEDYAKVLDTSSLMEVIGTVYEKELENLPKLKAETALEILFIDSLLSNEDDKTLEKFIKVKEIEKEAATKAIAEWPKVKKALEAEKAKTETLKKKEDPDEDGDAQED